MGTRSVPPSPSPCPQCARIRMRGEWRGGGKEKGVQDGGEASESG